MTDAPPTKLLHVHRRNILAMMISGILLLVSSVTLAVTVSQNIASTQKNQHQTATSIAATQTFDANNTALAESAITATAASQATASVVAATQTMTASQATLANYMPVGIGPCDPTPGSHWGTHSSNNANGSVQITCIPGGIQIIIPPATNATVSGQADIPPSDYGLDFIGLNFATFSALTVKMHAHWNSAETGFSLYVGSASSNCELFVGGSGDDSFIVNTQNINRLMSNSADHVLSFAASSHQCTAEDNGVAWPLVSLNPPSSTSFNSLDFDIANFSSISPTTVTITEFQFQGMP